MEAHLAVQHRALPTRRAAYWGVVCLIAMSGGLSAGCRMLEPDVRPRPPQGCAECHADITRQWSCSKHAIAWSNPDFAATTNDFTDETCLPCHAPTPLLQQAPEQPAKLRDHDRQFGVDCMVCHFDGCEYAGPYDSWGPHPMTQETARLKSVEFCGTCHLMEQQEYKSLYLSAVEGVKKPKTCAECHMPAHCSRLTQGHVLSLIHPKRVVRDHSFPIWTEQLLHNAIELVELEAHRETDEQFKVHFTLVNRGAGHRIPTAKFGDREVLLRVELLDSRGQVVGKGDRSLLSTRSQGLPPEKPKSISLFVPVDKTTEPASVRLIVERVNLDRSFRRTLLTAQRPATPDEEQATPDEEKELPMAPMP